MNFNSINIEKYAYISVSIHFLLLPQSLSATISLQSAMLTITLLFEKINENIKKERKRKEKRRNEHCDTMKSKIFLLYATYNWLLYCCTTVYVCSCIFVLYPCSYKLYSLIRKIQHCTLLCVHMFSLNHGLTFNKPTIHETTTSLQNSFLNCLKKVVITFRRKSNFRHNFSNRGVRLFNFL